MKRSSVLIGSLLVFSGVLWLAAAPSPFSRPGTRPPGLVGQKTGWMMQGSPGTGYMMPYYNQSNGGTAPGAQQGGAQPPNGAPAGPTNFRSNAERTYYTATTPANRPITANLGTMHMASRLSCIHCHGPSGAGGTTNMMIGVANAPPITWSALTKPRSGGPFGSRPSYDAATVKRAIRQGVGAAGHPLRAPMPRWSMTDAQSSEMVSYLRSLR
jgi:mono/diheme cytochrome c family protein